MKTGDTIINHVDDMGGIEFYWLCATLGEEYLFFSWLGNPYSPTPSDYWKVNKKRFEEALSLGRIEVYDNLPLDKYGNIFEEQVASKRNK